MPQGRFDGGSDGSILLLTLFAITFFATLAVSYWKIIQMNSQIIENQRDHTRAQLAAEAGINDAISEFRAGHAWDIDQVGPQWNRLINDTPVTLFKSSTSPIPITNFDYPTTFSVMVSGNPDIDTVTITSVGTVQNRWLSGTTVTLCAQAIRTPANEVYIFSVSPR